MDVRSRNLENSIGTTNSTTGDFDEWPAADGTGASGFHDRTGRTVGLARRDELTTEDVKELVEMYAEFDPPGGAHGLPPVRESRIREWLDALSIGFHALGRHRGRVVGHAVLVPTDEAAFELAIFVHQDYRHAGIGTRILTEVLAMAVDRDVPEVRLYVEHSNDAAIGLYESVGFEGEVVGPGELEMRLSLPA
ncbi:GNAT family N-acetyltransferase [Haloarchaeobius amylolyticus]|uniref:GNAT family N-acetyltransferase n=1 Tax=Haloarchaeobius amylolyticus TaxID=1198296 RepID=UPI002271014E|nr:GNAT family N-acetyltransferase [Haloarchaeobius amylolyticus]